MGALLVGVVGEVKPPPPSHQSVHAAAADGSKKKLSK